MNSQAGTQNRLKACWAEAAKRASSTFCISGAGFNRCGLRRRFHSAPTVGTWTRRRAAGAEPLPCQYVKTHNSQAGIQNRLKACWVEAAKRASSTFCVSGAGFNRCGLRRRFMAFTYLIRYPASAPVNSFTGWYTKQAKSLLGRGCQTCFQHVLCIRRRFQPARFATPVSFGADIRHMDPALGGRRRAVTVSIC